jgi:Tol biopolymer transport system component
VVVGVAVLALVLVGGAERAPVNGDVIAFSCGEKANRWSAICTARSDGSDRKRVTDGVSATDPTWSPDGRTIAFTEHVTDAELQRFTQDHIAAMDADGGDLRQLIALGPGESSFDPTWSPSGDAVAFLRSDVVASDSPTRLGRLTVASADGSNVHFLGGDAPVADPDWSPDGRTFAITVPTLRSEVPTLRNTDIHLVDAANGARRPLVVTPDAFESSPAWSPDGSRVAFARWRTTTQFDGEASIHVVDADGSGVRQVLAHAHYASGPFNLSWSPDGKELVFETSPSVLCVAISVVVVDTGAVRPLTTCARASESTFSPSWQPAPATSD